MHRVIKALEKIFGHGFGNAVNQALAQLGDLSTHRRMHGVGQLAARVVGLEQHGRVALAKPRCAALPFKVEGVRRGRHDLAQDNLARKLGRHRPDLERHANGVLVLPGGLDLFATGDAGLEHGGVVQRVPGLLLGDCQLATALHVHCCSLAFH